MEAERPDPPARRVEDPPKRPSASFARAEPEVAPAIEPARIEPRPASPSSNACDWVSVQAAAVESRRQVKMVVEEAEMVGFKDGCVSLKVPPDLLTAGAGVQEDIRQLIARTWGRTVRVEFERTQLAVPAAGAGEIGSAGAATDGMAPEPTLTVANATDNPLIAKAVELFGAKVLGVYPRQK